MNQYGLKNYSKQTRRKVYDWGSKDELITDVHLWTLTHERASVGRPTRTYIHQLCTDTGCSREDQPGRETMGMDGKRESGNSVLLARLEDDDDDINIIYHILYSYIEYLYSYFLLSNHYLFSDAENQGGRQYEIKQ